MGHQWHSQCGGGGNESWGRSSGELTSESWASWGWERERAIVTSLLWQCHITTESVTTERTQCHCRTRLLTNIHICGSEPNNLFPRISLNQCREPMIVYWKLSWPYNVVRLQFYINCNWESHAIAVTIRIIPHTIDTFRIKLPDFSSDSFFGVFFLFCVGALSTSHVHINETVNSSDFTRFPWQSSECFQKTSAPAGVIISWHWASYGRAGPGLLWPGELSWDRWVARPSQHWRQFSVSPGAESRLEQWSSIYNISIRLIIFRHSQWYKPAVRPFLKPLRSQKITKNNRKVLQVRWERSSVIVVMSVMWCSIGGESLRNFSG